MFRIIRNGVKRINLKRMHKESGIKIKTRKNKPRLRKELNILSMRSFYKMICHLIHILELYLTVHRVLEYLIRTVEPSSYHL